MKFTIAIPCFGQAEYLPYAIESALSQKGDIEIIVVNDGSKDNAKEIAEKYPVKLINQVNKGLPSARNTAIMNMTGEIFFPLDADDMMMDGCVEKVQEVFEKTDADIVAPSFKTFGFTNHSVILADPTLHDFIQGNYIGYFSAVKKEKLLEVGGYSPRMFWGYEDYHLWIDLLKRGAKLQIIKEPLILYRTKPDGMLATAQQHHQELMQQIFVDHPELYA